MSASNRVVLTNAKSFALSAAADLHHTDPAHRQRHAARRFEPPRGNQTRDALEPRQRSNNHHDSMHHKGVGDDPLSPITRTGELWEARYPHCPADGLWGLT